MRLTSPEFEHQQSIPTKFSCDGDDVNPTLVFADLPADAQSLALIVDDPDAPGKTWVHWVVYDMPVVDRIEEDTVPGLQGKNDFGRLDYGGPCPPGGEHRYFFKAYALNGKLNLSEGASKAEVEKAMEGKVLDQAELVGLYKR
jgi:hypothetical protein